MGYANDQIMKTITMITWGIITIVLYGIFKKNQPSSKEKGITQDEIRSRSLKEFFRMVLSAGLGFIINIVLWAVVLV